MAEEARAAFETIRDPGVATPADIAAAFTAYAERAIAANDGVADSAVRALAAQLGMTVETVNGIDKIVAANTKLTGTQKNLSDSLDGLISSRESYIETLKDDAKATADGADARAEYLRTLADEAEQRGDLQQAADLTVQALQAEQVALQNLLALKKEELASEQSIYDALVNKANLDGTISEQEQAEIDRAKERVELKKAEVTAIKEAVTAKQEEVSASKSAADSTEKLSEETEKATTVTRSWEEVMARAGMNLEALGGYLDVAKEKFAEVYNAALQMRSAANWDGEKAMQGAAEAASKAAALAEAADKAATALSNLSAEYSRGDIGLSAYISQLSALRNQYQFLADEDLAAVTDALAEAKKAMEDMARSAGDSLRDLQIEWANYRGEIVQATLLQQEADRLDVELALIEAKRNGNTEEIAFLNQKLALLKEYQAAQLEEAALKEAQNKIDEANEAAKEAARLSSLSAEERAYESTIDNLKKQLAAAIVANDAALQKSLLAQVQAEEKRHATTMANLETETRARTASATTTATAASSSRSSTTTDTAVTTVRTVNFNIRTSSASGSVRVIENDADTLDRLLQSLETGKSVT
ncbi:MAG: hypothetical protein MZV65_28670 [Chromatiales bacterium]|nr:hypothetical protein [Chromatiales bacterium]